jgi:hypothetical protein
MESMAARGNATRDVWAIVEQGKLEELRQALPSDEKRRKLAVCVIHPQASS